MIPNPRGWEAIPTLGALIYTRITWAFSPSAPQVLGVITESPLCPWCFEHSLWKGAWHVAINRYPLKIHNIEAIIALLPFGIQAMFVT
jgi:hypothetical protein